ncbi:MAG: aminoacyltransferase [Micrococcales bacterium]|nr:aminoacyltransferase [Micrococcales bacterium]
MEVRAITPERHREWIATHGPVSFLQTPAWGEVKEAWSAESVGFFLGGELTGTALILSRTIPRTSRSLAYVPEGPALLWEQLATPTHALKALADYAKARGAFALTIGPAIEWRAWQAKTVKDALARANTDPTAPRSLAHVDPDHVNPTATRLIAALEEANFRPPAATEGFADGQPAFVFQLPLTDQTEESIQAGFNQLWRRNIRKAEAAGVRTSLGTEEDLAAFHEIYQLTAARDHFTPRPLAYFQQMWRAMRSEDPDRLALYLAHHEDDLIAATLMTRVGSHVWYSYGASTTAKREVRGSNAIQWAMIRDALARGATTYDLRGITDTLDPADPHAGLVRFKVGTGGRAVQYPGEWTLPLRPASTRPIAPPAASKGDENARHTPH